MSAAVRFLAVAVAGWVVIRGMTAGLLPGAEAMTISTAEAAPSVPPIVPTQFPPIEPVQTAQEFAGIPPGYGPPAGYGAYAGYAAPAPRFAAVPVYYPAPVSAPVPYQPAAARKSAYPEVMPEPAPQFYAPIPQLDEWPLSRIASASAPEWRERSNSRRTGFARLIPQKTLDRLQLSAWALWRGTAPQPGSLASGGTLGGSQAGARLTYSLNRQLALSVRSSSPIGGSQGGELAAGVRVTPFRSIPIAFTAERRQAIGRFSTGRSDFALFAEGGIYQRPIGWDLVLDGYGQAGVVGLRSRDVFADGGLTVSRPLYGPFSAGIGTWGGYQPGLYRIDAGPRLSMKLRPNLRLHLDWRQRLAGTAEPRSGPALTLAADF
jgi:hypothetical protein